MVPSEVAGATTGEYLGDGIHGHVAGVGRPQVAGYREALMRGDLHVAGVGRPEIAGYREALMRGDRRCDRRVEAQHLSRRVTRVG